MQSLQSVLFTLINHEAVTGTKSRFFELKNRKIFWGGGTAPSPDPSPMGRVTPPHHTPPLSAPSLGQLFFTRKMHAARREA